MSNQSIVFDQATSPQLVFDNTFSLNDKLRSSITVEYDGHTFTVVKGAEKTPLQNQHLSQNLQNASLESIRSCVDHILELTGEATGYRLKLSKKPNLLYLQHLPPFRSTSHRLRLWKG